LLDILEIRIRKMKTTAKPGNYQRIAMACQGGGSLGAYHIGALKAMEEANYSPDLVAGISIGAFTAAIIAGNDPKDRVAKLREFWDVISWPGMPGAEMVTSTFWRKQLNTMASLQGFVFGQPNFFTPRFPPPSMMPAGTDAAESFYDTKWLVETLKKFVDFDGINNGTKARLQLGVSRVKDGQQVFFDSATTTITPEHVIASGAMPPGFPGIRIDGDLYWDGGCISNTPLEGIFRASGDTDTLCFMIDLFGPNGTEPQTMDEVTLKIKELQFASRSDLQIDQIRQRHHLACAMKQLMVGNTGKASELKNNPLLQSYGVAETMGRFDIIHLVYDKPAYEIPTCDCEFSRASIADRADHGYRDMQQAIAQSPWLAVKETPREGLRLMAARPVSGVDGGSQLHKFLGGRMVEPTISAQDAGQKGAKKSQDKAA
jgi:NTE family protein